MKHRKQNNQQFSTENIGHDNDETVCKRDLTLNLGFIAHTNTTLYFQELTQIVAGTAINARATDLINCRGFKIKLLANCYGTEPHSFNYAIVSPRNSNTINNADFFRGYDTNNTYLINAGGLFDATADINSDEYVVIKHNRVTIAERMAQTGNVNYGTLYGNKSCWYTKELYVPINRQLRYESALKTSCTTKIFIVYWFTNWMVGPSYTPTNFGAADIKAIMYFKDDG